MEGSPYEELTCYTAVCARQKLRTWEDPALRNLQRAACRISASAPTITGSLQCGKEPFLARQGGIFHEIQRACPTAREGGIQPREGERVHPIFFGIIAGDVLYLKADEANRQDYERAGSYPFKPYAHRSGTMKYYAVPVDVLESPIELAAWARKAIGAAERSVVAKRRLIDRKPRT